MTINSTVIDYFRIRKKLVEYEKIMEFGYVLRKIAKNIEIPYGRSSNKGDILMQKCRKFRGEIIRNKYKLVTSGVDELFIGEINELNIDNVKDCERMGEMLMEYGHKSTP